MSLKDFRN